MKTFAMSNHFYLMDGFERPQDYAEQAKMLRASGIDGYYFNLGRSITEQQITDCVSACNEEGLEMASMYWIADINQEKYSIEIDKFKQLMEWIPDGTPIELGYMDSDKVIQPSSDEALDISKKFTQEVLPICQSKNCLLSPYPHFIFLIETVTQGMEIVDACGGEGLAPVASAFHSHVANEDWLSFVAKDPKAFQSVSICGISKPGNVAGHSILQLGDGDLIDCKQIVHSLTEMGYEGWIGVQAYSVEGDSKDIVANSGKMLRAYLES